MKEIKEAKVKKALEGMRKSVFSGLGKVQRALFSKGLYYCAKQLGLDIKRKDIVKVLKGRASELDDTVLSGIGHTIKFYHANSPLLKRHKAAKLDVELFVKECKAGLYDKKNT